MRITMQQCMLVIATIASIVMTGISAMDGHAMAVVFVIEAFVGAWALSRTLRQKKEAEYRTEEEY